MESEFDAHKKTTKDTSRKQTDILRSRAASNNSNNKKSIPVEISEDSIIEIPLNKIKDNPFQPRKHYNEDSLIELGISIREDTLLQPVGVRAEADGTYTAVFGHRRIMASRKMKFKTIRAILQDDVDNSKLRRRSLTENIQRDDMHPIDVALSLTNMLDEGDYKEQQELADGIGKDKSYVSKMISILSLPKKALDDLKENKSINDSVAIDLIRKIKDSVACEEVYFWYIENKPTRVQLKVKIKSYGEDASDVETYNIKATKKGVVVSLPVLSESKLKEIEEFVKKLIG